MWLTVARKRLPTPLASPSSDAFRVPIRDLRVSHGLEGRFRPKNARHEIDLGRERLWPSFRRIVLP
jgi:hypothetical protein